MFVVLVSFAPVAAAQSDGVLLYCPGVGFRPVCPNGLEMPVDDRPEATGSLPGAESDRRVPLAKGAIVLIGVGGALIITARRRGRWTPARSGP